MDVSSEELIIDGGGVGAQLPGGILCIGTDVVQSWKKKLAAYKYYFNSTW